MRLRQDVPLDAVAAWRADPERRNPVDILTAQDADRLAELVPARYGRMARSPFAFLRGSTAVMAADLSMLPTSGLSTQVCGDAHLANFGAYATPERRLVFDLDEFDETAPGPWELDLRRLAASVVVAGREAGLDDTDARAAVSALGREYRQRMQEFAGMRTLDVWYADVPVDDVLSVAERTAHRGEPRGASRRSGAKHDVASVALRVSEIVGDRRVIREQPPLLRRLPAEEQYEARSVFLRYLDSLPEERQHLVAHYVVDDVAVKVVGVGSVGTRCYIVLLHGWDVGDPLLLQVKQATRSVIEPPGPTRFGHHGRRVVLGQRMMQAASDVVLGWTHGPRGRHFYVRQLWDEKTSVDPTTVNANQLRGYARRCASALARAHARSGDPVALAGYLGEQDAFERALAGFAVAYADQNERDHAGLCAAISAGRVAADPDG